MVPVVPHFSFLCLQCYRFVFLKEDLTCTSGYLVFSYYQLNLIYGVYRTSPSPLPFLPPPLPPPAAKEPVPQEPLRKELKTRRVHINQKMLGTGYTKSVKDAPSREQDVVKQETRKAEKRSDEKLKGGGNAKCDGSNFCVGVRVVSCQVGRCCVYCFVVCSRHVLTHCAIPDCVPLVIVTSVIQD